MSQPGPRGAVSERLAAAAEAALVGREAERARLAALLAPPGPAVVFVHGPGGIGKTTLVTGTLARLPMHCVYRHRRRSPWPPIMSPPPASTLW
jgi:flagellar biosynthesis GTPase FlhF